MLVIVSITCTFLSSYFIAYWISNSLTFLLDGAIPHARPDVRGDPPRTSHSVGAGNNLYVLFKFWWAYTCSWSNRRLCFIPCRTFRSFVLEPTMGSWHVVRRQVHSFPTKSWPRCHLFSGSSWVAQVQLSGHNCIGWQVLSSIIAFIYGHLFMCLPFWHVILLCLKYRWRPETHSFYLPFGEMTVSLQDC